MRICIGFGTLSVQLFVYTCICIGFGTLSELIWELPDLIWHRLERKVSVLDGRSEDFKNKCAFSMGGTHIDVTTLARNAYFFSKMQDLQSKTLSLFVNAQNRFLRFTSVWNPTCVDFLSTMHVSELIWELPDLIWHVWKEKYAF